MARPAYYYLSADGSAALGPCQASILLSKVAAGELPVDLQVCMEGTETWLQLTSVPPEHFLEASEAPATVETPSSDLQSAAVSGILATSGCGILVIIAILFFILVCAKILLS